MSKYAKVMYQNQIHSVEVRPNGLLTDQQQLLPSEAVTWLPPASGMMYALGLNYADHASELDFKPPEKPLVFVKTHHTYTGHNSTTWRPDNVDYMHYECELVVVIGKTAKNVKRDEAMDYVAGYTLCNDYAIRDYLENYYRPNLRVKNRVGTTPVGPWIVDKADVKDPMNLTLRTWVNGELCQEGNTKDMIFDIAYLIEHLSHITTLQPGDMIATGTQKGLADVKPGDCVEIEIEQIGKLTNYIVSETAFFAQNE
ncbi:4-hydroxyphenylacetate degradation bifunctional isomerase/decarboxylase [Pasteurella multocida subsp. multocida str. HN06]|uniref:fumarylacetoacetate hydrolase family protein n=1 Tax=Pasteurella multocida TaxID=747 RepID=UPI0002569FB8|nr:fumarylacetoacetate hydrolase family protein [Pasteurella multocida]AFF25024.1 4-hydroxyphenylacetate degradation bifunctional isomerase/decarboxylase [Pasteurella multocida subsp. multocida str. HN06]